MKRFLIFALLAPLLLLTGCNEATQRAREQGTTDRYNAQLAHQLRIEEMRLANVRKIAQGNARMELEKQANFHAFIDPFGRFVVIVLVAGGLVAFFRFVKHAHDENNANRELQLATVREAEETARKKFQLALEHTMTPEFFAQLSDEHRSQLIAKLEGPPPETLPPEPQTPLHERMYDDAKSAWGRFWNRRAA